MRRALAGLLVLLFGIPQVTNAELTIEITGGNADAVSIAIAPFTWAGSGGTPPTADFARIISSDLKRSGRFNPTASMSQPSAPDYAEPANLQDFRKAGIEYLVVGRLINRSSGYQAEFKLYNTADSQLLLNEAVTAPAKDQRFAAHHIADLVYEKLTGERGAFATRIAYVVASGNSRALKVADSDGLNAKTILTSNEPILSPAWSPDGRRLAYVSFETGKPAVYVQELTSGNRSKLTDFPGLNGAPAWSPDGSRLALTLSKDGSPDIYIMQMGSRQLRRLTSSDAIDTEPTWSPDGQWIAFTSDRGGRPQVYRVAATGGSPQRLTFEGSYNADASWSPDGKSLALISRSGNDQVAILDLDSRGMQTISTGALNESPSYAPNGSMVVYAAAGGVLSVVAVDYDVQQRLATQSGEVRDPAWSPFLIKRKP
jgi:TolB protein